VTAEFGGYFVADLLPWPKNFRFIRGNNFRAVQLYK
jgi:hypothetical protein